MTLGKKNDYHDYYYRRLWIMLMFFEELNPLVQELMQTPAAFLGGFASGVLRLNLGDDPVKSWLEQQGGATYTTTAASSGFDSRNNGNGPQSIKIE